MASADAERGAGGKTRLSFVPGPEEATMSTPADHPHDAERVRRAEDLGDLLEDFTLGMMFFAGAAIAVTILVLLLIL